MYVLDIMDSEGDRFQFDCLDREEALDIAEHWLEKDGNCSTLIFSY